MYRASLIFLCFAHKNMKRQPSKVGYFNKIEVIFLTALTAQTAQTVEFACSQTPNEAFFH